MAPATVQNPPAPVESKTAKKKKIKAARTESPAPVASETAVSVAGGENPDDSSENAYIRELSKNIRNVSKKLTYGAKIETLINEHSGKSLDELVASKIINADQAASHLKRPALQAQLFQLEQQLAQHKQIDAEHRARLSQLETTLKEKFEKEKADLAEEVKQKVEAEAHETLKSSLLVVSQFLRLAAARRLAEADTTIDENAAVEGVLLHIYGGDNDAVTEMLKLVQGSDERVISVEAKELETTFAKVKEASYAYLNPNYKAPEPPAELETAVELKPDEDESAVLVETDPTVANAGLTEVDDGSAVALTNGHAQDTSSASGGVPSNADVTDSAANAAGESQWDTGNTISDSQEWVSVNVPRDLSETDTGATATPAQPSAPANNQSWADDHPETAEAAAPADDGFHQVQGRNRGSRDGGHRGRGGFRGRGGGFRGDGRGRGRGRGDERRGFPSRPRRADENQG
ncbi:hypothetical protein B0T21DRAFT_407019 [Apiosordaria backusii]|uniref:YAG7-like dimerisation domain-containing protein n=1 Tax=Apiosordaria backusii TaxID=314023 RepID=A0AA40EZN3_9PEZI|nr:hypothetical protein B0T21DRAFT_407019 [Apiosordaria backusii]